LAPAGYTGVIQAYFAGVAVFILYAFNTQTRSGVAHRQGSLAVGICFASRLTHPFDAESPGGAMAVFQTLEAFAAVLIAVATVTVLVFGAASNHRTLTVLAGAADAAVSVGLAGRVLAMALVALLVGGTVTVGQAGISEGLAATAG